jgi:hypothetical protein
MTEAFLHYVWQFQYFEKADLMTTAGESISIFTAGYKNQHSGPDFFSARIRIGEMEWVGNVEIHIHSSGWTDHKHDLDDAYENVILHVVWNEDKKIRRRDTSTLPTLELKNRVTTDLLLGYKKLINNPEAVPCAGHFNTVPAITKISMVDKALMQRLETKAAHIQTRLLRNENSWEDTAYQLLSKNFGFKVNVEGFEQLAQSLPYRIIMKQSDSLLQVEALLFGQAGFLEASGEDEYFLLLRREYALLSKKYNLEPGRLNKAQWRFLRLRPANFPTLRLSQLAALLTRQKHIFSRIIEATSYNELLSLFTVTQSGYWRHHYQFFKPMKDDIAPLGIQSVENILINTAVPLLVAYGKSKDEQAFIDRAVDILQHISSEDNTIIKQWSILGMESRSSADSQGLIELHNSFCLKRRCLQCNIGFSILQPSLS